MNADDLTFLFESYLGLLHVRAFLNGGDLASTEY